MRGLTRRLELFLVVVTELLLLSPGGLGLSQHQPESRSLLSMFDLSLIRPKVTDDSGVIQVTGTNEFDKAFSSVSTVVQNLFTAGLVALAVSLWVTIFVYWTNSDERSDPQHDYNYYYNDYHPYHDYQDYITRRQDHLLPLSTRMSRVLQSLSSDSLSAVLSSVKSLSQSLDIRPTISRMESGVSGIGELVSVGAGAVAGVANNDKVHDCLLQTVCYLSAGEETNSLEERSGGILGGWLSSLVGTDSPFEGRKKTKEERLKRKKEKKEKRKRKKQKLKDMLEAEYFDEIEENDEKKDVIEEDEYVDDEEYYYDDEDYEEEGEVVKTEEESLEKGDCEVFKCGVVSFGHKAFRLYNEIEKIRRRVSQN